MSIDGMITTTSLFRTVPLQKILQNRFRVLFTDLGWPGADTFTATQQVRSITLPGIHFSPQALGNSVGLRFWDEITGTLMKLLLNQCRRQLDEEVIDSQFQMRIEMLNNNDILRVYSFKKCQINDVVSSGLTYHESEPVTADVSVGYKQVEILDAEGIKLW